jgi:hypothetical protein
MPIGKLFYSPVELNLNLPGITRVSTPAWRGTQNQHNPGDQRELMPPVLSWA